MSSRIQRQLDAKVRKRTQRSRGTVFLMLCLKNAMLMLRDTGEKKQAKDVHVNK